MHSVESRLVVMGQQVELMATYQSEAIPHPCLESTACSGPRPNARCDIFEDGDGESNLCLIISR